MSQTPDLAAIAREIKTAQDKTRQLEPFTSRLAGFDLASAYAVARQVHATRLREGAVPVGRKIGFTNPAMWDVYGVREPIWAYIYDRTVVRAAALPVRCAIGAFAEPRIEPEIIFHFRSAPMANATLAEILACIDWVAHGFEIVQSHFPGWKFQAADTVADQSLHGTLLVGTPQPVDRLGPDPVEALAQFSIALYCGGALRDTGKGANVLGNPLAAIAHLTTVLAAQPQSHPLQAGEVVTTGTLTAAHPVRPGETWRTAIEGIDLPGCAVAFTAHA
ncbi:MAG: 2-keto-4-pentenoate hydratase [Burkholderiales bacterium]